ncbi:efflux RND transporter periplasmic adaptor subunit [Marinibactrum halimedae]|uniref:RND transporter MFP subunit n=1 Tax=Marinibactrum halimedae TaxID=1444977 RepID=A0AA37WM08_9GAMM|nr:HlyD family efflux transporter periplasmic adaptor subunit [Marinibactrum halimedae]MCD9459628.1 HlyD family efflux transporter periplasmic adaptor subunit [Marinibactrum halimedae]GLS25655.1 RND transporter MFP subunit [Marinibactrum halimedae]
MSIRDTSAQDTVITQKSSKRWWRVAGVALVAVSVMSIIGIVGFDAEASINRTNLRTAVVERGLFVRDVNVTGRVVAANAPRVYSAAKGTVHILKQPGETVLEGEKIAALHSPELENQLQQAQTVLQSEELELSRLKLQGEQQALSLKKSADMARVNHLAAQRELRRAQQSFAMKVISDLDFAKAKDDLTTAELELDNAEQERSLALRMADFEVKTKQVAIARQQLIVNELQRKFEQLDIVSPVEGIMGNWLIEQDSSVEENTALLVVVDLNAFEGEVDIPQSYANELASGMSVAIRLGTEHFSGVLKSVSPEVDGNIVRGRIAFEAPEGISLRQKQNLSVRILLDEKDNVLFVNRGRNTNSQNEIYRVIDGMAKRHHVEFGSQSINQIEVVSGLSLGDEIVISDMSDFNGREFVRINN